MEPVRKDVRSLDGTPIPTWRSGEGRPLILIHGALSSHESWDRVRPLLEPHCTVVTMDRRAISGDPASTYDVDREFEDIAAIAADLGPEVDILGQSSGGICALGASLITPNLRRLILYEPPLLRNHGPRVSAKLNEMATTGDDDAILETFFREAVLSSQEEIDAMKRNERRWAIQKDQGRYMPREFRVLVPWQLDKQRYATMTAPTLLIVGGATPEGHHHRGYIAELEGVLPNLTIAELAGQEHFGHVVAPVAFADLVIDFLASD